MAARVIRLFYAAVVRVGSSRLAASSLALEDLDASIVCSNFFGADYALVAIESEHADVWAALAGAAGVIALPELAHDQALTRAQVTAINAAGPRLQAREGDRFDLATKALADQLVGRPTSLDAYLRGERTPPRKAGTFTDTFDGAGSTTNLESWTPTGGTAWTLVSGSAGSAQVRTTGVIRAQNAADAVYVCDDQGSADQYTEALLSALNSGRSDSVICCRLVDASNWIGWRNTGTGSIGLKLSLNVAGSVSNPIEFQGAAGHVYRIECEGDKVRIYDDGVQQGAEQTISDHQTETSQGLRTSDLSNTDWLGSFEAGTLGGGANQDADWTAGASLGATFGSVAGAHASLTAGASLGMAATAMAAAADALLAGLAAGEAWAAAAATYGTLASAAELGAAMTTGQVVSADLSIGLTAGASFAGEAAALAALSAGTALGSTFVASAQAAAQLVAGVSVGDVLAAVSAAIAELTAGAGLGAAFATVDLAEAAGALYATITIRPALRGEAELAPALSATVRVRPGLRGRITIN